MYSSTPWTRCQLMAGQTYRDKQPFPLTFTHKLNLKLPIHLSLHTEKPCPPGDSTPDPSCCENVNHCTTELLFSKALQLKKNEVLL